MDKLFRINPVRARTKDGETVTIEHRIGKEGGAFTKNALMDKLGLEKEYYDMVSELEKKFRDRERFKRLCEDTHRGQIAKMHSAVKAYRKYIEQFYANHHPRPLVPMFAFVPISEKADGLYVQGLLDEESLKLVVGEPEDDALWSETVFTNTKRMADLNARARRVAKALLGLPGLNKDIAHRVQAIAQGNVPEHRISFKS